MLWSDRTLREGEVGRKERERERGGVGGGEGEVESYGHVGE